MAGQIFCEKLLNSRFCVHSENILKTRLSCCQIATILSSTHSWNPWAITNPVTDGLCAEHYELAGDLYCSFLALCFNAMFIHGYIPVDATQTIIIPTTKDTHLKTEGNQFGFERGHSTLLRSCQNFTQPWKYYVCMLFIYNRIQHNTMIKLV